MVTYSWQLVDGSYDFKNIGFCYSTFKILLKIEGILYEMVEYLKKIKNIYNKYGEYTIVKINVLVYVKTARVSI